MTMNWLRRIVRAVGRGLLWWLEQMGRHPPLSRDCWPGPIVAEEIAERARRAARQREAPPPPPPDLKPRRRPPRRSSPRRDHRRAPLLGC